MLSGSLQGSLGITNISAISQSLQNCSVVCCCLRTSLVIRTYASLLMRWQEFPAANNHTEQNIGQKNIVVLQAASQCQRHCWAAAILYWAYICANRACWVSSTGSGSLSEIFSLLGGGSQAKLGAERPETSAGDPGGRGSGSQI